MRLGVWLASLTAAKVSDSFHYDNGCPLFYCKLNVARPGILNKCLSISGAGLNRCHRHAAPADILGAVCLSWLPVLLSWLKESAHGPISISAHGFSRRPRRPTQTFCGRWQSLLFVLLSLFLFRPISPFAPLRQAPLDLYN